MKINYRSKEYVLPEDVGSIQNWPKGALMILHFSAATQGEHMPNEVTSIIGNEVGKFLNATGTINEKGRRGFANDREVLDAADTASMTPCTSAPVSAARKPESAESADSDANTVATKIAPTTTPFPLPPDSGSQSECEMAITEADVPDSATAPRKPDIAELLTYIRKFLLKFVVFSEPTQAVAISPDVTEPEL